MVEALPTTMQGWLGWGVAALIAGPYYFTKFMAERRGEKTETESLRSALDETRIREQEERNLRREAEAQHKAVMMHFHEQNATNARLEVQMKHLLQQNEELKAEIHELRTLLNERNGHA